MNCWKRCLSVVTLLLMTVSALAAEEKVYEVKLKDAEVEQLKQKQAYLMSISEEQLIALVPVQSGIFFTDCPNCDAATQDWGNWTWTPQDPTHITCKDCGEVYPGNSKYPETGQIELDGPENKHVYPYYERPEDKYRFHFKARADFLARDYMDKACRDLANVYWMSKDETYAHRAALILIRFAEVYPGYAYHFDYPFREKVFWAYNATEFDHPVFKHAPPRLARYDWWRYMDIGQELVKAYDALRYWPKLKEMADGRAIDMIENDLIVAMVEFALDYTDRLDNMGPTNWRRVIRAGRVMHRPAWIHEAVDRFERFLTTQFLYDGHWQETSPSYNSQCIGGISVIRTALGGYVDPEGYTHPQTGRRLDRETLKRLFARYERSRDTLTRPALPGGRLIPINDTWWTDRRGVRKSMKPDLLPGLGVAVMGGGQGDKQLHVHLNFTSGHGHKHNDSLSFGLFANEKELLPDIGYTHTAYRAFGISTMSHNTVVVNGVEQQRDGDWSGNRLRAFVTDGRAFHLAEAESASAYPPLGRYRRTLMTVGHDSADAYVIDIFQVRGGEQHDYLLHGSADDDSTASIDGAAMESFEGTLMNKSVKFREPKGESDGVGKGGAFGLVRNITRGRANGVVKLDMLLDDNAKLGTRTWLAAERDTKLYLGEAPSIRRARRSDQKLPNYMAPFFSARRNGKDLTSTFVAVHEPVNGKPRIQDVAVKRWPQAIVVTITTSDGVDYAVIAKNNAATARFNSEAGGVQFQGRYGLVRTRGDKVAAAHLVGGKTLRIGSQAIDAAPLHSGAILDIQPYDDGVSYGYFDVAARIENAGGSAFVVHHPDGSTQAYNITKLEPRDRGTRIYVAEDAGFEYTKKGIRTITYPRRSIKGQRSKYELLSATHYRVGAPGGGGGG